ncbi:hypothetical protein M426DRAFT_266818 [Hypoxylon sp. CI-4A]|nr:hypothetical protein M426DRAFT_266818 [Hypoxylon sp. CI-4A]
MPRPNGRAQRRAPGMEAAETHPLVHRVRGPVYTAEPDALARDGQRVYDTLGVRRCCPRRVHHTGRTPRVEAAETHSLVHRVHRPVHATEPDSFTRNGHRTAEAGLKLHGRRLTRVSVGAAREWGHVVGVDVRRHDESKKWKWIKAVIGCSSA